MTFLPTNHLSFPFLSFPFPSVAGTAREMFCCSYGFWRVTDRLIVLDITSFVPMMVSRMVISLKKVASSQPANPNVEVPSTTQISLRGGRPPHPEEGIHLTVFKTDHR